MCIFQPSPCWVTFSSYFIPIAYLAASVKSYLPLNCLILNDFSRENVLTFTSSLLDLSPPSIQISSLSLKSYQRLDSEQILFACTSRDFFSASQPSITNLWLCCEFARNLFSSKYLVLKGWSCSYLWLKIMKRKGQLMENASPSRLGTIWASCCSVQRSLALVACLQDDTSFCYTGLQKLCCILSCGPNWTASEMLQAVLKVFLHKLEPCHWQKSTANGWGTLPKKHLQQRKWHINFRR